MFFHKILPFSSLTVESLQKMNPEVSEVNTIRVLIQSLESNLNWMSAYEDQLIDIPLQQNLTQFLQTIRDQALVLFPDLVFINTDIPGTISVWYSYLNIVVMIAKELDLKLLWALTFPGPNQGVNIELINAMHESIREFGINASPLLTQLLDQNQQFVEQVVQQLAGANLQALPNGD